MGAPNNINEWHSEQTTSSLYDDQLLMRHKLSIVTGGVPGELFAVFMNLHLSALKLIQLLADSSLRDRRRAHTHIHTHHVLNQLKSEGA